MRTPEELVLRGVYFKNQKIEDKLQQAKETISIGSVDTSKTKVQTSHGSSTVETFAERRLKIFNEIYELQQQIDEIMNIIDRVSNVTERTILRKYARTGKWKESASGYSGLEFRNLKESALKHFGEILQNTIQKGVMI